jgi:hypothetical protein
MSTEPLVSMEVIQKVADFIRPSPYEDVLEYIRQFEDGHAGRGSMTFPPDADPGALYNLCCQIRGEQWDRLKKPNRSPFERFLLDMQWHSDHWGVLWKGMYIGIEVDGYIHS